MHVLRTNAEVLRKFVFAPRDFGGAPKYFAMDTIARHTKILPVPSMRAYRFMIMNSEKPLLRG